jgi:hypothetical protein
MYNDCMEPQFQPIISQVDDNTLIKLVDEIEKVKPLLEQGLLRQKELEYIEIKAHNAYEGTADHNSIQYRKYDKQRRTNTRWNEVNRTGYVGINDAANLLEIQQQIIELLNLHSIDVQPTELFIPPNASYTARFYIRNILSTASVSIDIKDDYLFSANANTQNIDILWILQPYLQALLGITARLLGSGRQNPPSSTASDIKTFLRQNNSVEIKGVSSSQSRESHDRFIIVDGKEVYKIGASIKDLGAAQTSIDIVREDSVKNKYIQQFNGWWQNAQTYSNLI